MADLNSEWVEVVPGLWCAECEGKLDLSFEWGGRRKVFVLDEEQVKALCKELPKILAKKRVQRVSKLVDDTTNRILEEAKMTPMQPHKPTVKPAESESLF